MREMLVLVPLMLGCAGKSEDETGAGAGAAEPQVVGTVQPDGESVGADFAIYHAFAFDQAGSLIMYLSSTPTATCESVSTYLNVGRGDPIDPVDVFTGGTCNMLVEVPAETVGYEGSLNWTRSEADGGIDEIATASVIECAMGDGAFEVTTLSDGDEPDYYWTGGTARWWQGTVVDYSLQITGGDGSPYDVTMEIAALKGGFPHEGFSGNDPATGNVSGTIQAEWCTPLASTGLFGS